MINETINQKDSERIKNIYQQLNSFKGKKADALSSSEKLQLMALYRSSKNIKGFPPLSTELKKLIAETIRTQKTGSSSTDIAMAAAAHEQQIRAAELQTIAFVQALKSNPSLIYNNFNLTLRAIENGYLRYDTNVTLPNGKNGTFADLLEYEVKRLDDDLIQLEQNFALYQEKHKKALYTLAHTPPEERAKKLKKLRQIDPDIAKALEADLKNETLMREIKNTPQKPMSDDEFYNMPKERKKLIKDATELKERATKIVAYTTSTSDQCETEGKKNPSPENKKAQQQLNDAKNSAQKSSKSLDNFPKWMTDPYKNTMDIMFKNKKTPEQGKKALEQTATPQAEEAPIILPNTEEKVSEFSKKEDLILHTLAQLSPEERAKKLEQLRQIDSNSAAQLELELKNPERMKKIAAQGNLKSLSDEELKQYIKDETTVKKTTKDEASSSLQTTLKNAQTTAEPTPESTEQRDDANNTQKTGLASYAQPHQPNSVVDSSYKGR